MEIGASWRRSRRGRALHTALGMALLASLWSGLAAAETAAEPDKAAAAGTTIAGAVRPDQMVGIYGTHPSDSVLELRHEGGRYLARLMDFRTWEIEKDVGDWEIVDAARIRLGDEICEYTFRPYRLILTGCSLQGQWRTACRINKADFPEPPQSPADSVRERCERSWDHMWSLARTGNPAYLSLLSVQLAVLPMISHGEFVIIPPGMPSSPASPTPSSSVANNQINGRRLIEHIVALELYGWKCSLPGESTKLKYYSIIGDGLFKSIASCTAPEAEADQCLKDAIRLGLIPEFTDYVKMVEREGIANLQCVSKGIQK